MAKPLKPYIHDLEKFNERFFSASNHNHSPGTSNHQAGRAIDVSYGWDHESLPPQGNVMTGDKVDEEAKCKGCNRGFYQVSRTGPARKSWDLCDDCAWMCPRCEEWKLEPEDNDYICRECRG